VWPGVIRTRVGYCGGKKPNPTYYDIGDHTESIQIDYDPKVFTYEKLLSLFWEYHCPTYPAWNRQYMSALFFSNDEEKALAVASKAVREKELSKEIFTKILPVGVWTNAEDYHQKYYLRTAKKGALLKILQLSDEDILNSTLAARVNGYTQGHGNLEEFRVELDKLGKLSGEQKTSLLTYLQNC